MFNVPKVLAIGMVSLCLVSTIACAEASDDLAGLWKSYKHLGPEVEGLLLIDMEKQQAQIGPYSAAIEKSGKHIKFSLPDSRGRFVGQVLDLEIRGHWIQPPPIQIGQNMASPVVLRKLTSGLWQGRIDPRRSEYTFFLPLEPQDNGSYETFLRNPDRNLGLFTNIQKIERQGEKLSFLGVYGRRDDVQTLAQGHYAPSLDRFTMNLPPWRGGTYEFKRVAPDVVTHFRPRSRLGAGWEYSPPPQLADGWPTSTLADAKMDLALLRDMFEKEILTEDDSLHSHRVHGVLIARHGKLVLEEYFHGFNRNMPHDTRSASKSVASMLVGAAMHAGYDISPSTKVFDSVRGPSPDRDTRKEKMTLQDLLTMSSGFYCDDNDPAAPGNEGTMQDQTDEPDWYKYTLDLPMADDPGAEAIYCSANSNLIGAVLGATTQASVMDLFAELIARPLGVEQYYLGLQPTGEVYFGGGAQWLPRDFMKIGQVMLNGGTWNGQRIVSSEWAATSTSTSVKIGDRDYGYQWWVTEYPYGDGTVTAFFAAGNGGQIVMGVPELDLLIAFYGGNYSDGIFFRAQEVLIPQYILKAVLPKE